MAAPKAQGQDHVAVPRAKNEFYGPIRLPKWLSSIGHWPAEQLDNGKASQRQ
jgi:hypothetical protein